MDMLQSSVHALHLYMSENVWPCSAPAEDTASNAGPGDSCSSSAEPLTRSTRPPQTPHPPQRGDQKVL